MSHNFIEKPRSKRSLAKRGFILGVGVNDAPYMVVYTESAIKYVCPYYTVWKGMLARCYSENQPKRSPSYAGCSVCPEWLIFTRFKQWMIGEDWRGKHLDKDLLEYGNRIYRPESCVFVTADINSIILDSRASRGRWPQGVYYDSYKGKFRSCVSEYGKTRHLGTFRTAIAAYVAYVDAKCKHVAVIAESQEPIIKESLINYANVLFRREGCLHRSEFDGAIP